MSKPRVSFYKIVICGQIVESFQYAHPIGYQLEASRRQTPYRKRRALNEQQISASSLSRTRNNLIRLINANSRMWKENGLIIQPQFITYTFAENIQELSEANPLFTNYIKRLNYNYFHSKQSLARYVVVPEFQERGAVHYHAVFFNLPKINLHQEHESGDFASVWEHGFIKVKNIKHIPNVGRYMTKYMTKEATDRRLVGRKKYFSTRHLIKPVVISHDYLASEMNDFLCTMKPIHAYLSKPTEKNPLPKDNPTFCATYHLEPEELQILKSFYSVPEYESHPLLPEII